MLYSSRSFHLYILLVSAFTDFPSEIDFEINCHGFMLPKFYIYITDSLLQVLQIYRSAIPFNADGGATVGFFFSLMSKFAMAY